MCGALGDRYVGAYLPQPAEEILMDLCEASGAGVEDIAGVFIVNALHLHYMAAGEQRTGLFLRDLLLDMDRRIGLKVETWTIKQAELGF